MVHFLCLQNYFGGTLISVRASQTEPKEFKDLPEAWWVKDLTAGFRPKVIDERSI
jgi:hypothetical protein